ncbi:MAG: hypothetical protein ACXADX_15440, partial [Candidatus Hodarchaeales archaeon]
MEEGSEAIFNFKFVKDGKTKGGRKKGVASQTTLLLEDERIPYKYIVETTTREKRLVLVLSSEFEISEKYEKYLMGVDVIGLEISKFEALDL